MSDSIPKEPRPHEGACTCPACAPDLWASGIKGGRVPANVAIDQHVTVSSKERVSRHHADIARNLRVIYDRHWVEGDGLTDSEAEWLMRAVVVLCGEQLSDGPAVGRWKCPACGEEQRHPGYIIGNHWLESAYERICAGESETEVMADYDYVRRPDEIDAERAVLPGRLGHTDWCASLNTPPYEKQLWPCNCGAAMTAEETGEQR